jgi:hypothetical protein
VYERQRERGGIIEVPTQIGIRFDHTVAVSVRTQRPTSGTNDEYACRLSKMHCHSNRSIHRRS